MLVLLGLLTAVALPALGRVYERASWFFYEADIERQLAGLRLKAFLESRDLALVSRAPPDAAVEVAGPRPVGLDLPAGWHARVARPILYRADGICLGGELEIGSGSIRIRYVLEAPRCWPPERHDAGRP